MDNIDERTEMGQNMRIADALARLADKVDGNLESVTLLADCLEAVAACFDGSPGVLIVVAEQELHSLHIKTTFAEAGHIVLSAANSYASVFEGMEQARKDAH